MQNKYEKQFYTYQQHGVPVPKLFKKPNRFITVGRSLGNRFLNYCLCHLSIQRLDLVMTRKLGKPFSKSIQVRREAKAFNEGYQKALKEQK